MFTDLITPLVDTGRKTEIVLKVMQGDIRILGDVLGIDVPSYNFAAGAELYDIQTLDLIDTLLRNITDSNPKVFTGLLSRNKREVLDIINNKFRVSEHKAYVEFLSKPNWLPGDFAGDSGSCWWGGKSHGRKMMQTHGGLALKFYQDNKGKPCARCWGINMEEDLVIFNLYEGSRLFPWPNNNRDPLLNVGVALANAFAKKAYALESLVNNKKSTDLFHINRGYGVAVGDLAEKYYKKVFDLKWQVENFVKCSFCGSELDAGTEIFYDDGERAACETHAEANLDICSFDKKLYDKRRMKKGPDNKLYYSINLGKVPDFVSIYKTSEFAFKKDSYYLGVDADNYPVWIPEPDKKLCPSCKAMVIGINDAHCRYCEPIDDILLRLKKYMVFPMEFSFSLPGDLDILEETARTLKATSLVREV